MDTYQCYIKDFKNFATDLFPRDSIFGQPDPNSYSPLKSHAKTIIDHERLKEEGVMGGRKLSKKQLEKVLKDLPPSAHDNVSPTLMDFFLNKGRQGWSYMFQTINSKDLSQKLDFINSNRKRI